LRGLKRVEVKGNSFQNEKEGKKVSKATFVSGNPSS